MVWRDRRARSEHFSGNTVHRLVHAVYPFNGATNCSGTVQPFAIAFVIKDDEYAQGLDAMAVEQACRTGMQRSY